MNIHRLSPAGSWSALAVLALGLIGVFAPARPAASAPVAGVPAKAPTIQVSMIDDAFQPRVVDGVVGLGGVQWNNVGLVFHTATTVERPIWLDIALDEGESAGTQLPFAGTFPYVCIYHEEMTGTLRVSPRVEPPGGVVGDTLTVTLATDDLVAPGFAVDVQRRRIGRGRQWHTIGRFTTMTIPFAPGRADNYALRSRLVDVTNDVAGQWSPRVAVTIGMEG